LIVIDGAHTHNSIQACADTFFSLLGSGSSSAYSGRTVIREAPSPAHSGTLSVAGASSNAKPILVFACAADKDPAGFAPIFLGKIARLYLTIPGSFKKGNLEKTAGAFTQVFKDEKDVVMTVSGDFNEVLKQAFHQSYAENRPLLITGSFYLAAEAQRIYSAEGFQDRETQA